MSLITSIGAKLGTAVANAIAGDLFKTIGGIFHDYFSQKISEEEAKAKIADVTAGAFARIWEADDQALASTMKSWWDAAKTSLLVRVIWAIVTISQLFIILWHQWAIPYIVVLCRKGEISLGIGYDKLPTCDYPSSGDTAFWAYLLLALCLGAAPAVFRGGPAGGGGIAQWLKSLVR